MTARLNILALAGITLGSVGAWAQPPLQVYDTSNKEVGRVEQSGLMVRDYGANPASLTIANHALAVNAIFAFTSNDCGQSKHDKAYAYYYTSALADPRFATYDGVNVWTADTNFQVINAQSYSWYWDWANAKAAFQCIPYAWQAIVSNPVHLESAPQWAPSCTLVKLTLPAWGDTVGILECKPVLTVK